MAPRACVVRAKWDDEAAVWYVSDSDLPGPADRNATLADNLREVGDNIGCSTTAMKTAIARGPRRVA
jgi:hypothetical protein